MSGFDAGWLALREPFDRAARAASAAQLDWPGFAAHLRRGRDGDAVLRVTDLGCGTGASLREVAPRLGGRQHWQLVDNDPRLLAALPGALGRWANAQGHRATVARHGMTVEGAAMHLDVEWRLADLAGAPEATPLAGMHLVTASALLDLVSQAWLEALIGRCCAEGAAVCWALSVDDRLQWQPGDGADDAVHRHFRAHQRRDKGFGPALGGAAVEAAIHALRRAGYALRVAASDWQVDGARAAADRALLREMIDGIAAAARAQAPDDVDVHAWQLRRLAQWSDPVQARAVRLQVGHTDLLGWRV